MEMKNKLLHHHKSKISIVMRNFSIVSIGLFVFMASLTVPTYLSIRGDRKAEMEASEIIEEETPTEDDGDSDNESDPVIQYE